MGSRENFARRPDQVVDGCLAASFCWCCGALQSRLDGQAPKSRLDGQAPTGQVWAETPLWQRIEGAVDGGLGDVGEAQVVVAGVGPQPGEGLGQIDAGAFGDHAFGLLDHHPAGQGAGELLVQALGLGAGAMLHDGQGGKVSEGPGDDDVRLGHRCPGDAEQVQGADGHITQPQRQGGRRGEAGLEGGRGKRRPAAGPGIQVLVPDALAGAERIQAGAFLLLELEQLQQAHRLARGGHQPQAARRASAVHPSRSLRARTSSATSASSRSLLNAYARRRISASVTLIPSWTETMPAALCTAKWKSAPASSSPATVSNGAPAWASSTQRAATSATTSASAC